MSIVIHIDSGNCDLSMQSCGNFTIKVLDGYSDGQQRSGPKKVKRYRSAFTTDQVKYLEKQFKKFPYIGNGHRKEVAQALNIPERAVKIWFQNRRMKEKKETASKDMDDEYKVPKPLEVDKDQLNNGNVPLVNEQRSLPLLNDSQTMRNKMITNSTPCNLATRHMVHKGIEAFKPNHVPENHCNTTVAEETHPPLAFVKTNYHSPLNFKKSPEQSIDMCKKYKVENLVKNSHVETLARNGPLDTKKSVVYQTVSEQMMPEDLSANRKSIFPTSVIQSPSRFSPNNSGYLSLVPTVSPYYTEPYLPSNSVIWKPVSVLPIVPSTPTVPSSDQFINVSPVQQGFTKRSCNCDCHVKVQMPYDQQLQTPQYFITAVPFSNHSSKFENAV